MISNKFLFTWFLIAFFLALTVNELNLYFVEKSSSSSSQTPTAKTVYGYTITNVDNYWYVNQMKNFMEGKGFTVDPSIPHYDVRRSPGYPLFFGLHHAVFGERYSYFFIRYTQLLMYALSVVLLGLFVFNLTANEAWARWTIRLFAACPFLAINCYYTITEAISISLIIYTAYLFSAAIKRDGYYRYLVAGLCTGIMILTRPVAGILIPALLAASAYHHRNDLAGFIRKTALYCVGIAAIMSPWIIRNYMVTKGELIVFEKYYNESPMEYGKGQYYFQSWISCWSNETVDYTAVVVSNKLQFFSQKVEERERVIDDYINKLPPYMNKINDTNAIHDAVRSLGNCFTYKDSIFKNNLLVSKELVPVCEEEVKAKFVSLKEEFIKKAPLRYYLITPMISFKEMVMNSASNAYGSLNPEGRKFNSFQILIKGLMYLLNVALYLSLFVFLFSRKAPMLIRIIVLLFSLATIVFFVGIIRYSELRYMLPIFPFLYISLAYHIQKIKFLKRIN
ncbi:MAG: glycosyltransferase family 39 protein [Bacteroidota bacterium]